MTDPNTLPTTDQCKAFTLALGGEWHEIKSEGYYDGIRQVEQPKCSCGKKSFLFLSELKDHIARNNPTYSDAASILLPMRKKLGERKYKEFINSFTSYTDCRGWTTYMSTIYFINNYIFNPALLIGKAIEWMRKEKGE